MARTWLTIRVELLHSIYGEYDPPPGRVMLVGPRHTFEQLARAIDAGFARWDLSHLHEFELEGGTTIGFPDEDFGGTDSLDHAAEKVAAHVRPGACFAYRFDFGDDWSHACVVEDAKADPLEVYGEAPREPVAIFGWGAIPDQYGRITPDDDAPPEPPFPFLHDELERILILRGAGRPMTPGELADAIDAEGRYERPDGSPVTASQVSARVARYPGLFAQDAEGRILPLRS